MIPKPTKPIAAVSPDIGAVADTTMAAHANDGTGLALETKKKKKWKDMDKSERSEAAAASGERAREALRPSEEQAEEAPVQEEGETGISEADMLYQAFNL
ncbi:MAG: hypothetical protein C5S41_02030 [Candidatus Methanomarinus sp.]|nr:MAG: hypothetical protein C5S41_02015 [ANME-2 cluster archaeon]KAF5426911.1 MAG: hypothetical protein C5S41_02030 [ANME-2 cluster archaeon]